MSETRLIAISDEQVERLAGVAIILEDEVGLPKNADLLRSIVTAYEEGITEEEVKIVLAGQFVGGYGEGPVSAKLRSAFPAPSDQEGESPAERGAKRGLPSADDVRGILADQEGEQCGGSEEIAFNPGYPDPQTEDWAPCPGCPDCQGNP